jgi:hypothetical protein
VVLVACLAASTAVGAANFQDRDISKTYGEDLDKESEFLGCTGSDCPDELEMRVCGAEMNASKESTGSGSSDFYYPPKESPSPTKTLYLPDFRDPGDASEREQAPCSTGERKIRYFNENDTEIGHVNLTVKSKGIPIGGNKKDKPVKADHLYVIGNHKGGEFRMYNMFISNSGGTGGELEDTFTGGAYGDLGQGAIFVEEVDADFPKKRQFCTYTAPLRRLQDDPSAITTRLPGRDLPRDLVIDSGRNDITGVDDKCTSGGSKGTPYDVIQGLRDKGNGDFLLDPEDAGTYDSANGRNFNIHAKNFNFNSWQPVHTDGAPTFNGSLMVGHHVREDGTIFDDSRPSYHHWFQCNKRNDKETIKRIAASGNTYRCDAKGDDSSWWRDTEGGDWEKITCSEGAVEYRGTKSGSGKHTFRALYDPANSAPPCDYQRSEKFTAENPDTADFPGLGGNGRTSFLCFNLPDRSDTVGVVPDIEGRDELIEFCADDVEYYSGPALNMPVAIYFDFNRTTLYRQGLRSTDQSTLETGDIWMVPETLENPSPHVDSTGWDPEQQTLKQAEKLYSENKPLDNDTWIARNLEDVGDYGHPSNANESWTIRLPDGMQTGSRQETGPDFDGGFAGKCNRSGTEFRVDTNLDGGGEVLSGGCKMNDLPAATERVNIQVNMLDLVTRPSAPGDGLENHFIGFVINESEAQKWAEAFEYAGKDDGLLDTSDNSNWKPPKVHAQCFVGDEGTGPAKLRGPASSINVVNITADLQLNQDTYVVGKVPDRSGAGLVGNEYQDYTCIWGFQQEFIGPFYRSLGFYRKTGNDYLTFGRRDNRESRLVSSKASTVDYSSDEDGGMTFNETEKLAARFQSYAKAHPSNVTSNKIEIFENFITPTQQDNSDPDLARSTNPRSAYPVS